MVVFLFICIFVLGIPLNFLSMWMKMSVNENLPDESRLSWWSRDFREVERIYGEQNPDSILPDLSRYGSYVLIALLLAAFLAGFMLKQAHR
jgi:hypothetical protein